MGCSAVCSRRPPALSLPPSPTVQKARKQGRMQNEEAYKMLTICDCLQVLESACRAELPDVLTPCAPASCAGPPGVVVHVLLLLVKASLMFYVHVLLLFFPPGLWRWEQTLQPGPARYAEGPSMKSCNR